MKTSELTDVDLDLWVARADRFEPEPYKTGHRIRAENGNVIGFIGPHQTFIKTYSPSTDWSQGGPIIDREKIMLEPVETWVAHLYANERNYVYEGTTPLVAAMRAYVASKFGEEVDDS